MPFYECLHPGCKNLVKKYSGTAYCIKHQKPKHKISSSDYDKKRGSSTKRGYNYKHYKRRKKMLKEKPLCERCLKIGKYTISEVKHHIDYNPFNISKKNEESLCRDCHEKEHKRKN